MKNSSLGMVTQVKVVKEIVNTSRVRAVEEMACCASDTLRPLQVTAFSLTSHSHNTHTIIDGSKATQWAQALKSLDTENILCLSFHDEQRRMTEMVGLSMFVSVNK